MHENNLYEHIMKAGSQEVSLCILWDYICQQQEELVRFNDKTAWCRYDEPFVKCRIGINQISRLAEYIWDYVLMKNRLFDKVKIFEKMTMRCF